MLLLCIVLIAGCGQSRPAGMPPLYGCVLTFLYEDGSPVDSASVILSPEDTELRRWGYSGFTDASGRVTIYTHGDFPGAPAGTYKVTISKVLGHETGRLDSEGGEILEMEYLVPRRYADSSITPLSLEITNRAVNETFKIER